MSSILTGPASVDTGGVSIIKAEQVPEEPSTMVSAEEFAILLMKLSVQDAARVVLKVEQETLYQLQLVKLIPDQQFRYLVANIVFGEKIAGDLGARTTAYHPKTDYGDAHIVDDVSEK